MSELLWVAVPGGLQAARQATLRVLIVPRLDAGTTLAANRLDIWPPDALRTAALSVEVGEHPAGPLGTHTATPRVDAQDGVWAAFFVGASAAVRPLTATPDRTLDVDETSVHQRRIEDTYRESARALRNVDSRSAFHDAVRTEVARYKQDAERPALAVVRPGAPPAQPPDFHRTVSLLREHPAVLRALGLIIELTVPTAALPAAGTGVVRVRWAAAPASLPAITSPWTAYTRDTFLPAASEGSDIDAGMLALGRPHWRLHTLDADSALGRLRDAAQGEDPQPATLPALRTAGVMLVRAGRAAELTNRQRAGRGAGPGGDLPTLTADDLVLGYRIDARIFGADWHSLCQREAKYSVNKTPIAAPLREEGHLKPRSAVDHGDGVLRADEVVARWDGWSMAAPRPALDGRPRRPARQSGLSFDFDWKIEAEPGTLLKLRFGQTYQLRARVADLAGGGRELAAPSPDGCDSTTILFTRHEPIGAPEVRLPPGATIADLGPGAALDLLVIRSGEGVGQPTADLSRLLLPPRAAFEVVERHGHLDGDAASTFPLIQRDGLPDPAAAGVAAFLRPEPGGPAADLEPKKWEERWPDFAPKRLVLRVRDAAAPTLDWETVDDLVVRLAPAEQATLEISSFPPAGLLSQLAISGWLPRAGPDGADPAGEPADGAVAAVVTGRHPMVTPARTLTLVHAVRRPLGTPAGSINALRAKGQTFAVLEPQPHLLGVDTASAASLEVSAAWTEVDDGGAHPVSGAPVQAIPIARGDVELAVLPRHEFGDTKHRRVTYTFTAVSRFRQFFSGETATDFHTVGTIEANVPSTASPAAPIVLSTVPAFIWEESRIAGVITRRRLGGQVRVELARPWFTTGAGEALAVLVADGEPEPALWPYLSQLGRDPIWDTPPPQRRLELAGGFNVDLTVTGHQANVDLEETGHPVRAVPHEVWSAGQSWYADIALPASTAFSYSPLVQLAIARYQPVSLPGVELSPVVRTDFVPLLPDRTLRVDATSGQHADVTLSGLGPAGPRSNRVDVVVEHCTEPAGTAELIALDPAGTGAPAWVAVSSAAAALGEQITVPLPALRPLRLRIREVEAISDTAEPRLGTTEELTERTVFTDLVPLLQE